MKRCKYKDCNKTILENIGRGRPQEYCEEHAIKRKLELNRKINRASRGKHSHRPAYYDEAKWFIDEKCKNCGIETNGNIDFDRFRGEAICKKCGLIIGEMTKESGD